MTEDELKEIEARAAAMSNHFRVAGGYTPMEQVSREDIPALCAALREAWSALADEIKDHEAAEYIYAEKETLRVECARLRSLLSALVARVPMDENDQCGYCHEFKYYMDPIPKHYPDCPWLAASQYLAELP